MKNYGKNVEEHRTIIEKKYKYKKDKIRGRRRGNRNK